MFPFKPLLVSSAAAAVLAVSSLADTIILKSGEKLEGRILGETATELTVEVKISAGVTDQTTIAKDTVAKIEKEQLDEAAWLAVKNIRLAANSLPAAQYDAATRPLQGFINDFPGSKHVPEAKKLLAEFGEEKKRVEAGEVRMGQKWLTKEEVGQERYQINASLAYQHMRAQAAANDLIGALNSFEQIEKNFPGARIFPDAVEAAKQTLAALKSTVERAQQTYQTQQKEFAQGVANSIEPQKSELIAARQRELAQGEAAVAAAERAGLKWPQLLPRSDKSISVIAQKIPSEQQRLAALEVAKMRESLKVVDQARKEMADKKLDSAEELLRKATDLWNVNEIATRLQPELASLKNTASTAPAPAPEPEQTVITPEPAPPASTVSEEEPVVLATAEEKPFFLTPGGIVTALVILAILVAGGIAYNKIRHKASDILE